MRRRLAPLPDGARGKLALAGVAVLALVLAMTPGPAAPASLRALAAVAAIAAAALLARGRLARAPAARRLTVISRQALSREAGVALLEVDGRAVLVGFGASGVRLLAAPSEPEPTSAPAPEPPSMLPRRPPSSVEVRP